MQNLLRLSSGASRARRVYAAERDGRMRNGDRRFLQLPPTRRVQRRGGEGSAEEHEANVEADAAIPGYFYLEV